jgi:hypothetical protein
MNKVYNRITTAATLKEYDILQGIYEVLLTERESMNEFFEAFLSKCNLTKLPKTSPSWITYDKKFAEYSEIESNIKTAEFYLRGK